MSRTIVVLGGSGFVGRALVARLLARGDRVRVPSRNADAAARIPAGAEPLVGDVFDGAFLRKTFERADARFQPVWIGDVVDAFLRALDDDTTVAGSYDLVGPEVMTLAEIVRLTASTKGWTRFVVSLPDVFGRMQAEVGEHLPGKPISRDNWRSLQRDSTSDDNGLPKLGITPTDVRGKLPGILGAAA